MSQTPPMPLDTDAYLADTGHLSTLEHGAYNLILMALWRSPQGALPGDDKYLARATRMTLGRWKRIAPTIRALLTDLGSGKVGQKRVQRERRRILSASKVIPSENQNSKAKSLKTNDPIPKTAEIAPGPESPPSFFLTTESKKVDSKRKKERGYPLPENWVPADAERLYGRTVLHLTDEQVDHAAEQMRRWALTNAHRDIGNKPRWDLAFRNWLDRYAQDLRGAPRPANGVRRGNGRAALALRLHGIEDGRQH